MDECLETGLCLSQGIQPDFVAKLSTIAEPLSAQYVPILLLSETDDQVKAQQALAIVFNYPQVAD